MAIITTIQATDVVANSRLTINSNFAALNAELVTKYAPGGTDVALADGGTGASLNNPGVNALMFWDNALGQVSWATIGSGLQLVGSVLSATGGGTVSPLTTKGDIYTFSSANTRLAVGTNGQVLIADSTQATGLRWGNAATGTVTTVGITTANGISGSVSNPTTTPAISLMLGAITPTSVNGVAILGSSSPILNVSGPVTLSGNNSGDQNLFSTVAVPGQGSITADAVNDVLTIAAGSNVTIDVDPVTDTMTINARNQGGIAIEQPATGAVDGVNATFTFAHVPLWLTVAGLTLVEGHGYTRTGLSVTFSVAPGSGVKIHNFYNPYPTATGIGQMIGLLTPLTYPA